MLTETTLADGCAIDDRMLDGLELSSEALAAIDAAGPVELTTITLERKGGSWMATWTGPDERRVTDLFGTNSIPTAFTAAAPAGQVLATIRRLNPNAVVRLAGVLEGGAAPRGWRSVG